MNKILSSKKMIVGCILILTAFVLSIINSSSISSPSPVKPPIHSQEIYSKPVNMVQKSSYSNSREKELREKINNKIDEAIELIDEITE